MLRVVIGSIQDESGHKWLNEIATNKYVAQASSSLAEFIKSLNTGDPTTDFLVLVGSISFTFVLLGLLWIIFGGRRGGYENLAEFSHDIEVLKTKLQDASKASHSLVSAQAANFEFLKQELILIREEIGVGREYIESLYTSKTRARPRVEREAQQVEDLDTTLSGRR